MRDGMGVERLREDGVATAIVTRERSPQVARRAEKLALRFVYLGVRDKASHLRDDRSRETGVPLEQLAYIGDDVNDLGILAGDRRARTHRRARRRDAERVARRATTSAGRAAARRVPRVRRVDPRACAPDAFPCR